MCDSLPFFGALRHKIFSLCCSALCKELFCVEERADAVNSPHTSRLVGMLVFVAELGDLGSSGGAGKHELSSAFMKCSPFA